MIPNHLAIVPLSPERRAAMQAVAEVERRLARNTLCADYPYAHAFFRILKGSKRITVREIRKFSPSLSEHELRGNRTRWISAIDQLIESRGANCPLPLSSHEAGALFPEILFNRDERNRRHRDLTGEKRGRLELKLAALALRNHQSIAGQAEIELAFETPETVSGWSSRWSGSGLSSVELEDMFFRWSERFPSLAKLERWMFEGVPLWQITSEASAMGREATEIVRTLERWMVPNKLTFRKSVS